MGVNWCILTALSMFDKASGDRTLIATRWISYKATSTQFVKIILHNKNEQKLEERSKDASNE